MDSAVIVAAVARYAARLHAAAGTTQHVAAPLGAWLLLALCATASDARSDADADRDGDGDRDRDRDGDRDREELLEALGVDRETAARTVAALLANPHPAVASAAALWTAAGAAAPQLSGWTATLPPEVTTGLLPGQDGLDAWAREHTLGLIEHYPLTVDPSTLLILATALATRVSWDPPFDLAPAAALGTDSAWSTQLHTVLRTPSHGHRQFIASTRAAGDVAVHAVSTADGVTVVSVSAASEVPAAQVLAAAYSIAPTVAVRGAVLRRSLFDLPLGDGAAWTVTERPTSGQNGAELVTAVLPAWSISSTHGLLKPGLGFAAAAGALARLIGVPGPNVEAVQSAVARYSRTGFEAAAVTAFGVAVSARIPRPGRLREAELRFAHPYAVVAVTTGGHSGGGRPIRDDDPWHGLPVFSAWITEPADAADR